MANPHIEDRDSTWARTAKDLIAGAAGGIAQVLIGMRSTDVSFLLLALCSQPRNSDSSAFRSICTPILSWIMFVAEIPFGMRTSSFPSSYCIELYDVAIIPQNNRILTD